MHQLIENIVPRLVEAAYAVWPSRRPAPEQLARASIVAHRGERDGVRIKENTIAAFDPVIAAGVGAIEFDVRYTRDDEPVVIHDADLTRVFGHPDRIDALTWHGLARRVPELPHLADVIQRYGDRAHLMIELKARGSARAEARMRDCLADLRPGVDFHVLSLLPALFEAVADMPARARLPVAKSNWRRIFDWSRAHDCGGLAGPHLLIRNADIAHTRDRNRLIGSGFINRRGLLMREIARDIPWIFTNRPLTLQRLLETARAGPS